MSIKKATSSIVLFTDAMLPCHCSRSSYTRCSFVLGPVMQNATDVLEKKVKELQDDLAAVQFTPHSKNGKMLMAKCRTLQEENEEIGREASEGKVGRDCCCCCCFRSLLSLPSAWPAPARLCSFQSTGECFSGIEVACAVVVPVLCGQFHDLENKLALQKQLNAELKRGYQGGAPSAALVVF